MSLPGELERAEVISSRLDMPGARKECSSDDPVSHAKSEVSNDVFIICGEVRAAGG